MSTEFQIIFTSIMTLLAGLALFVLKGVFRKFEVVEADLKEVKSILNGKDGHGERLTAVETKLNMCPSCGRKGKGREYDE